jgi:hypothetical protein
MKTKEKIEPTGKPRISPGTLFQAKVRLPFFHDYDVLPNEVFMYVGKEDSFVHKFLTKEGMKIYWLGCIDIDEFAYINRHYVERVEESLLGLSDELP